CRTGPARRAPWTRAGSRDPDRRGGRARRAARARTGRRAGPRTTATRPGSSRRWWPCGWRGRARAGLAPRARESGSPDRLRFLRQRAQLVAMAVHPAGAEVARVERADLRVRVEERHDVLDGERGPARRALQGREHGGDELVVL